MANEYLKRTPTSTGNRKIFTYAGWFKKNNADGSTRFDIFNAYNSGLQQEEIGFRADSLRYLSGGSTLYGFDTTNKYRDTGNWFHIVFALNTTLESERKRSLIYINGVEVDTTTSGGIGAYVAKNFDSIAFNVVGKEHNVLARKYSSSGRDYAEGGAFDIFFVDGQALTPDVFGFYKDGDGYQSSGTSQATDFRPGQWSPHSPRKIKTEIERKGGFGVNGFYLPMNDSSNPGADFHCDPNSIITLKGEDLPQPQNGAPTTSDAFVSQLRQEEGTLGFDGVVKFDGVNDYLSVGSAGDFNFLHDDTSSWTAEYFVYPKAEGTRQTIFSTGGNSSVTGFCTRIMETGSTGGGNGYYVSAQTSKSSGGNYLYWDSNPKTLASNRWYHVALVYNNSNNTLKIYVDGELTNGSGTASESGSFGSHSTSNSSFALRVGEEPYGGGTLDASAVISNLRIVTNTTVYTSNFTAPTEPLTNITNTTLLCCQSITSATAATVTPGTITATGDVVSGKNEIVTCLVLAVPGISTATGANLVTNGTFDNNVSNWTATDSTVTWENFQMKVQRTAGGGLTSNQAFTTVSGKRYTISATINSSTSRGDLRVYNGSGTGGSMIVNFTGTNGQITKLQGSFTASSTTSTVVIAIDNNNGVVYVDNVVVKQEDPPRDYSADIKGSGTNKTLTTSGNIGVGYELGNYYGSAIQFNGSNGVQFDTGYSIDGTFGSGDYTIECWIHSLDDQGERGIFGMLGSQYGISLRQFGSYAAGGNLTLQAHFGQSAAGYRCGTTVRIQDQWNHVAMVKEGTKGTLYLNGVAVGIANNVSSTPYSTSNLVIGIYHSGSYPFKGYIQDFRVYTTAKYKGGFDVPKPYTPVGIESWRQVPDTCKNNFATLNSLSYQTTGTYGTSYPVLTDGNLRYTHGQTGQWERSNCTMGAGEGKWYFEFQIVTRPTTGNTENWAVGLRESDSSKFYGASDGFENQGDHVYWIDAGTAKIVSNTSRSGGATSGISGVVNGDIINIAFEKTATALKVWFGKNGTYFNSGNPATGANPAINHSTTTEYIIPSVSFYQYSGQPEPVGMLNFGQNPSFSGQVTAGTNTDGNGKGLFKYAPPSGFLALCEDNLPTPAIADPGKHFKTVLWSGSGSGRGITGVGFQPDLVWLKSRTNNASNRLSDAVRGVNKQLMSNTTEAEVTFTTMLTSFDSDGFTLGDNVGINGSGYTNVAWCWKAGGAAVSNTDGSITTQVSANRTSGFSIVTGTQTSGTTTFGHGLGKAPKIIITKQTNGTTGWYTYVKDIGYDRTLRLDQDSASASFTHWVAHPTTSVFSMGSGFGSGEAYVAYCFAEIDGFSKIGVYAGNGNADGTFVYCGFKPAWVLIKNADQNGTYWTLFDSSRKPTNPANHTLNPNLNHVEETNGGNGQIDLLSNGFKCRNTDGGINGNGVNYVFIAFAESPFQTANAK